MKKKIGITCDYWKIAAFRKRLLAEGYELEYDGESGVPGVWLFRVECDESEYEQMKNRVSITLRQLEIEVKQSN